MERHYDFIVVGSGIAGLFYSIKVAELNREARIAIITKKGETDSSTNRAQGGIAAVLAGTDSFEAHITDTVKTGQGLCHREVVEKIVEAGPSVIKELIRYGVEFTRVDGAFDLGREGGHSHNRVVHATDFTGQEIERALLAACRSKKGQIDIYRDHIALDVTTFRSGGEEIAAGVFVFSEKNREFTAFYAPVTMLCTGGLCQAYYHNTNPKIATGDGLAIAYRAGVSVANLEFIQFHPTLLYNPGRWPFLISEAVRGEGARLMSVDGRFIMDEAHEQKDLAPRDVVARVIDKELKESGEEYVLLDISHRDGKFIRERFPNIYKECLRRGFDITQRPIPVVPAAHYACGGVVSTIEGETELPGLYTAGEIAMTGMHGANRLASNSLLEAVVMAEFAAGKSTEYFRNAELPRSSTVDHTLYSSLKYPREKILVAHDRRELTRIMSDFFGIVRSEERLNLAREKVRQIKTAIEQYYLATPATYAVVELRNMATVAELIIKSALLRLESRGLHYIVDYPGPKKRYERDTVIPGLSEEEVQARERAS
ncbi:MAG: L-aspartate oxidase [Candidatus Zixiibacteriota bacterium]|nr:MAG: L-aspartate oxidase [candidate division Zixibacteria bacterium]